VKFQVKALRDPDGVVSVVFDAADEADAERQARSNGLAVLSLRRAAAWNLTCSSFKRRSRFPLALFAQELLALAGSRANAGRIHRGPRGEGKPRPDPRHARAPHHATAPGTHALARDAGSAAGVSRAVCCQRTRYREDWRPTRCAQALPGLPDAARPGAQENRQCLHLSGAADGRGVAGARCSFWATWYRSSATSTRTSRAICR